MARNRSNRPDFKDAYGRYSGTDQGEDRRKREVRDHDVYGYGAWDGPGYAHESGPHRHGPQTDRRPDHGPHRSDYYDPDQRYRATAEPLGNYRDSDYGGDEYRRHFQGRAYGGHSHSDVDEGHRGKGPRGYKRSDERIQDDVCDALTNDWNVDATDIEVTVQQGEVTLSGFVAGRRSRRDAEAIAEHVVGVNYVQNNLRVGDQKSAATGHTDSLPARPTRSR